MKLFILLSLPGIFYGGTSFASKMSVVPSDLKIIYEDQEGAWSYPCKAEYTQQEDPYDFTVKCYNGKVMVKQLSAHVAYSVYHFNYAPKTRIEILYWVNGEGATSWLMFDEIINMTEYQGSQSVAGEPTALRLTFPINKDKK